MGDKIVEVRCGGKMFVLNGRKLVQSGQFHCEVHLDVSKTFRITFVGQHMKAWFSLSSTTRGSAAF